MAIFCPNSRNNLLSDALISGNECTKSTQPPLLLSDFGYPPSSLSSDVIRKWPLMWKYYYHEGSWVVYPSCWAKNSSFSPVREGGVKRYFTPLGGWVWASEFLIGQRVVIFRDYCYIIGTIFHLPSKAFPEAPSESKAKMRTSAS